MVCFHLANLPTYGQKRREGGARGGGGRPSNVLQDHFSNSSNSDVKFAGGGGKADDLGNYSVYEYTFLQPCHFNCIFHFPTIGTALTRIFFSCRSPQIPDLRTLHDLHISST